MGEPDEEELQRAFLMSLQPAPEAKRSKPPRDSILAPGSPLPTPPPTFESSEASARRLQRELRAAAAEQRMMQAASRDPQPPSRSRGGSLPNSMPSHPLPPRASEPSTPGGDLGASQLLENRDLGASGRRRIGDVSEQLPFHVAKQLFAMVFGRDVTRDVLAQWCNQGFRFSSEKETSLGLVQHEGGPCGVLAPIQALVLKYLLFVVDSESGTSNENKAVGSFGFCQRPSVLSSSEVLDPMLVFSDVERTRALVLAMGETLWLAGHKQRCIVAVLDMPGFQAEDGFGYEKEDEVIGKALEGVSLDSVAELHRLVRICTFTSMENLLIQLGGLLPGFRSRVGALLFLFSVLLSRGLDAVQSDRDDPLQPLVTSPFGHISQEIVNLLICGQAVANVFDGNMDLGGGMCLKGIPTNVEVGFLTLLEYLNLCKVGQYLKCPKWPIWVVGSESHYTVLFALRTNVQEENELEEREMHIRHAFDSHDQSGGGGFITPEALQQVLLETNVNMPHDMLENLYNSDIVVWNDLWQALHQLEKNRGGLKDPEAVLGKRQFEIYHFNGIAKTVSNSSTSQQRPRLTKLRVIVPPKWTPEEFMEYKPSPPEAGAIGAEGSGDSSKGLPLTQEEPPQHAPLVDCIRTRWQRATCNWSGDPPSIV